VDIDEQKKIAEKQKKVKKRRISQEEKRLRGIYKDLPAELAGVADGLIRRAAYMRVTLEDYEQDLDEKGYVELFSQSEKTEPYERERPVARLYNTMNKNYQSIIKQLADMLPKPESDDDGVRKDDGFDEFVMNR